ncbi:hypothetical protein ABZ917_29090 [Nonomuraea wenchangensis]
MLTRIEIDGFTSFLDVALGVPPFLALVGPNARRGTPQAEGARVPG